MAPLRESQANDEKNVLQHRSRRESFVPPQPTREIHLTLLREFGAVDQRHRRRHSDGTRRYKHQVSFP